MSLLFVEESSHLLENLKTSEQVICEIWSALVAANTEGKDVTAMLMDYTREAQTRDNLLKTLVNVYEAEIKRLKSSFCNDHLTNHQKSTIKEEIKVLKRCFCSRSLQFFSKNSHKPLKRGAP